MSLMGGHVQGCTFRMLPGLHRRASTGHCSLSSLPGHRPRPAGRCQSSTEEKEQSELEQASRDPKQLDKQIAKFARSTASTFAPRGSGSAARSKNPAFKGSTLYTIFEVQAWASAVVGALLSYNIIFPTDKPSIARLLGMWSIWMLTVPALRARECTNNEKDALNLLFVLIPLMNVGLPFVWKSFPFIFSADCVVMVAVYAWKVGLPGFPKEGSGSTL